MSSQPIPDTICEIQDATSQHSIPLVLIHDGGGTVFNYWTLGSLHRQVYAISDPAFESGADWKGWEGGLVQMAELYCKQVKKEIGKGKILLGGWSLGGLISLAMSHIFAQDGDIEVKGLIMIDSPNFELRRGQKGVGSRDIPSITSSPNPRIRANVSAAMARSQVLINGWELPRWDTKKAPPAVLIRAMDHVPVPAGQTLKAFVDLTREYPQLGWEKYPALKILSVLEVPGLHHFNMFGLDLKAGKITSLIAKACDILSRSS